MKDSHGETGPLYSQFLTCLAAADLDFLTGSHVLTFRGNLEPAQADKRDTAICLSLILRSRQNKGSSVIEMVMRRRGLRRSPRGSPIRGIV